MGSRITLLRPGVVPYQQAWEMQQRTAADVIAGASDTLILLEHPPVYTLGVRGKHEHVLASEAALRARGAEVIRTDRGGDVTFHGPGQIVGYPIINVRGRGIGPAAYVRLLEATLIETLGQFAIDAARREGRPGAWVGEAKVAAIGVRVSRGVTTHGFALNVNTDLTWFDAIIPCGLAGASVTSMQQLVGHAFAIDSVMDQIEATLIARLDRASARTEATVGR